MTDTRTIDELKRDIIKNKGLLALWQLDDKRTKRVKYEITWHDAFVKRDEAELERRLQA